MMTNRPTLYLFVRNGVRSDRAGGDPWVETIKLLTCNSPVAYLDLKAGKNGAKNMNRLYIDSKNASVC